MKNILFILALSMPFILSAQKCEFGLEGGLSVDSKPTGNMYYKGEKYADNYSFRAQILSNMSHKFQMGIELETSELSRLTGKTYLTPMDDGTISGNGQRLVYSKLTPTLCGILNKKINFHKGYVFGGVAAGAGMIVNLDKTTTNSQNSYIGPSGGMGPCLGLQVGLIRNITKQIALTANAALRYYNFYYAAHAPNHTPYTDLHYEITTYGINLGFRYLIPRKAPAPVVAPVSLPQAQQARVKDTVYIRDSVYFMNESQQEFSTQNRGNATIIKGNGIVIIENGPDKTRPDQLGQMPDQLDEKPNPVEEKNYDTIRTRKATKHEIKQHFEPDDATGEHGAYWILAGLYRNKIESEKALERVQTAFNEPSSVIQLGIDYGVLIKGISTKTALFDYLGKLNILGYSDAIDW